MSGPHDHVHTHPGLAVPHSHAAAESGVALARDQARGEQHRHVIGPDEAGDPRRQVHLGVRGHVESQFARRDVERIGHGGHVGRRAELRGGKSGEEMMHGGYVKLLLD